MRNFPKQLRMSVSVQNSASELDGGYASLSLACCGHIIPRVSTSQATRWTPLNVMNPVRNAVRLRRPSESKRTRGATASWADCSAESLETIATLYELLPRSVDARLLSVQSTCRERHCHAIIERPVVATSRPSNTRRARFIPSTLGTVAIRCCRLSLCALPGSVMSTGFVREERAQRLS